MKKNIVTFIFAAAFLALTVQAQNTCEKQTIEQLAGNFAVAYKARNLGQLDAQRPYLSTLGIRIENSLEEDGSQDQFVNKKFKSLSKAEKWLRSREIVSGESIMPSRQIEPLINCKKGICTYNVVGLLHNQLFLKRLSFSYKKDGCPYIKSVFLIDGN